MDAGLIFKIHLLFDNLMHAHNIFWSYSPPPYHPFLDPSTPAKIFPPNNFPSYVHVFKDSSLKIFKCVYVCVCVHVTEGTLRGQQCQTLELECQVVLNHPTQVLRADVGSSARTVGAPNH